MDFNNKPIVCGIYTITNQINNMIYVGQSIDIWRRWAEHMSLLDNNKHDNCNLQNDWNKYGRHNFKFEIFKECDEWALDISERLLIEINKRNNKCYNIKTF